MRVCLEASLNLKSDVLQEPGQISRSVEDAIDQDGPSLDLVENEIILDDQHSIAHGGQPFVVRDFSTVGIARELLNGLLDPVSERDGCRDVVGRDKHHNLFKVSFGNGEESDCVFTRGHGYASAMSS